ncbi:MAG: hypothetical protein EOM62_07280 [Bacteroidia bacterium]|jgi:hypothetical protein|nr:hypothetical protein [Bacteroidia bacterium]
MEDSWTRMCPQITLQYPMDKDAKFGIFIHWGLYSKLGDVWKNKNYYGSGE